MSQLTQPNREMVKQFVQGKTIKEIADYNFRKERQGAKLTSGIKGFKEYRISTAKFDCDRTELTMSIWCLLLEQGQGVREVLGYEGRHISYINEKGEIQRVETDTINSLETDLNIFIRKLLINKFNKSWVNLYTHEYRVQNGVLIAGNIKQKITDNNRDLWLIANYDEIFNEAVLIADEMEVLQALNAWSNYIHTIGNFMIGPVGFNFASSEPKAKSKCGKDQIDVFLRSVQSDPIYAVWQEELSTYMDVNMLDTYFEGEKFTNWNEVTVKKLREGETSYWINDVVRQIKLRGELLAERLVSIIKK